MIIADYKRPRLKPNMASLIDVIFLLLIFFMLTFSVQGQGMDLRLPNGQPSKAKAEQNLMVQLNQDNTVKINNEVVQMSTLLPELEARLKKRNQKVIVIQAERKIRYGFFANVLDIARQAGVEDFSIVR